MHVNTDTLQSLVGKAITAVAVEDFYRDSIGFDLACGHGQAFDLSRGRIAAISGLRNIIGQRIVDIYPYDLEPGDAGYLVEHLGGFAHDCDGFAIATEARHPLHGTVAAIVAVRDTHRLGDNPAVTFRHRAPCVRDILDPTLDYVFECN